MKTKRNKLNRAPADAQEDGDLDQPVAPDDELAETVSDEELEPVSASEQPGLSDGASEDAPEDAPEDASEKAEARARASATKPDRRRLEEQLEALKRKESELRRALIMADHPQLEHAIRELEGRAYALGRIESKLAEPPSKAEARRREAVEKKLASLREKRAELDGQIESLERELTVLGADRSDLLAGERQQALQQLFEALATHDPALREAGLDASNLVPEIARWLPEVEKLAETLVAARDSAALTN